MIGDNYKDLTLTVRELEYLSALVAPCTKSPPGETDISRWKRIARKLAKALAR